MPCYGPNFALGMQRLIGAQQSFTRSGLPTYLRLKNFVDTQNQQWSELGFAITPVAGTTGTVDILISPPPTFQMISVHNIGMSEGKLRFGARMFTVSGEFVSKQLVAQGLSNPEDIWKGQKVLGLVTENLLFSIEDIKHVDISGVPVLWRLTANANELR